jgi:hypothetical protein
VIPLPFSIDLEIFNSAGEQVRVIVASGRIRDYPLDWLILDPTALPEEGKPAQIRAGGQVFEFDGKNGQGQALAGGAYYARLRIRDAFGKVTSFSGGLNVIQSGSSASLCVSNSAGEFVRCLPITYASGAVPQGEGRLSGSAILPGNSSKLAWDNASASWDGKDAQGRAVKSGIYTLSFRIEGSGGTKVKSWQVQVLEAPETALPLKLSSNPWRGGALKIVGLPAEGRADLFNAAGERVAGSLGGEFEDKGWAPGVYIVRVQCGKQMMKMKFAVIR